ncbi:MAG: extracellular solute-binding protein [Bacilli bacterium]|nr:extracellular solute-binding protein [Bacilli bacterium]
MKKRKLMSILLASLMMVSCTPKNDNRVQISLYLWDKSLSKQLTPWLRDQFPQYKIEVVNGYNNMDYYTYLNNHGNLPDIISCRRFSINDAAHMSDMLLDLSKTEVAGTFFNSYIENNKETDGSIRWLPASAEVDGIVANKKLFDENNIAIPTNYAEFKEACTKFHELGIIPFVTDFYADYSCLELMQGSAISDLMTREGTSWRMKYESESDEEPVGLDDKVWPKVIEKFDAFLDDIYFNADEMYDIKFQKAAELFNTGKAAMLRATANDAMYSNRNFNSDCVMLPYFGETKNDNWVLTYPICQFAVNKNVKQNAAKEKAAMEILSAIFSKEGQERTAAGSAFLSYAKDVNIELDKSLRYLKEYIDSNHIYMRLASTEFFSISRLVGEKLMKGQINASEAYELFNSELIKPTPESEQEVLFTQEKSYSHTITEKGNEAASSVINTFKDGHQFDMVIGFGNVCTTDVYEGDYTEKTLKWLISFKAYNYLSNPTFTGREIKEILEWLINTEGESNPIMHWNLLPVTSRGLTYSIKDNKDGTYTLLDVKYEGNKLDLDKEYNVLLVGELDYIEDQIYCNKPLKQELKDKLVSSDVAKELTYYNMFIEACKNCGQLVAPSEYVTVK